MLRICHQIRKTNFQIRDYTARRAVLYTPGSDNSKIEKALALDVDCAILDCEDGVALAKKGEARKNIRKFLDKGKPAKKRQFDFAVRISPVACKLCIEDARVVLTGKNLPDTIFLPKVETGDDMKMFSELLDLYIRSDVKLDVVICIESALSLLNCVEICKTAQNLSKTSKFKPAALLFGSDDFCASIGTTRSGTSIEVSYARQKIVTIAKAFNLQAIDMVYLNFKDSEGMRKQASEGAQLGFTGKQVIHPDQVGIAHEAFQPSKKEIEWATTLLDAYHKHAKEGTGAFSVKGHMVDIAVVRQAQNIVDLINAIMVHEK